MSSYNIQATSSLMRIEQSIFQQNIKYSQASLEVAVSREKEASQVVRSSLEWKEA